MIEKVLVLATNHISEENASILTSLEEGRWPIRFVAHEYGWIFFVNIQYAATKKDFEDKQIPELFPIVNYAVQNGISHINFDSHADDHPLFETFEW